MMSVFTSPDPQIVPVHSCGHAKCCITTVDWPVYNYVTIINFFEGIRYDFDGLSSVSTYSSFTQEEQIGISPITHPTILHNAVVPTETHSVSCLLRASYGTYAETVVP
jgi:hypothetical protein